MRSLARFRLLVGFGGHLVPLVRRISALPALRPAAYVIDLHDPFGLAWGTALRQRFGRPDVAACLALAECSTPPGRAIVIGCVPGPDLAALAAEITAGLQQRFVPDAALVELLEVELRLQRPPPAGTFRILVASDHGAEVATERFAARSFQA
jgi:hypothetical protein